MVCEVDKNIIIYNTTMNNDQLIIRTWGWASTKFILQIKNL